MPCTTCQQNSQQLKIQRLSENRLDCIYDLLTLQDWEFRLLNLKINEEYLSKNLTLKQINSYLGYVKSAINNINPCYFQEKLTEISNIINTL